MGANSIHPERELGDDVIHEVDRILLCMLFINLQSANTGDIINGGILEVPNLVAFLSLFISPNSYKSWINPLMTSAIMTSP
jgi:hypothetical protein